METISEQLDILKNIYPGTQKLQEGEIIYYYIPGMNLPDGCSPSKTDVLLCPSMRDGYSSRLFFAEKITGCPTRNWNFEGRILDRTWYGISWRLNSKHTLVQMVSAHLDALRT